MRMSPPKKGCGAPFISFGTSFPRLRPAPRSKSAADIQICHPPPIFDSRHVFTAEAGATSRAVRNKLIVSGKSTVVSCLLLVMLASGSCAKLRPILHGEVV